MNADRDKERSVSEGTSHQIDQSERTDKIVIQWNLLNDEKSLIEPLPDRQDAGQDDNAKHSKRCDTRGLLLLTYYRKAILEVLGDPKATVGGNREEQSASSPSVNKVQFLVSMTGAEEGHDRILRCKEEDDRKLCK